MPDYKSSPHQWQDFIEHVPCHLLKHCPKHRTLMVSNQRCGPAIHYVWNHIQYVERLVFTKPKSPGLLSLSHFQSLNITAIIGKIEEPDLIQNSAFLNLMIRPHTNCLLALAPGESMPPSGFMVTFIHRHIPIKTHMYIHNLKFLKI